MNSFKISVIVDQTKLATVVELLAPEGRVSVSLVGNAAPVAAPVVRKKHYYRRTTADYPNQGRMLILRGIAKGMDREALKKMFAANGYVPNGLSPTITKLKRKGWVHSPAMGIYLLTPRGEAQLRRVDKEYGNAEVKSDVVETLRSEEKGD